MWSKVSPSVLCVLVLVGLIFTVIILSSIIRRLCGVRYSVVYRLLPIRVGFIGCRNFWLRDYNRGRAAVTCRVLGTNTAIILVHQAAWKKWVIISNSVLHPLLHFMRKATSDIWLLFLKQVGYLSELCHWNFKVIFTIADFLLEIWDFIRYFLF